MKICILTTGHRPYDSRIYHRGAKALKNKYDDITIIAPYDREEADRDGINIIGFKRRKSDSLLSRIMPLIEMYSKAVRVKADIYHCHEPDALSIGWLLKKRFGGKLIFDCHEYHALQFSQRYPKTLGTFFSWCIPKALTFLASKCDYIITASDGITDIFNTNHEKVTTLPNYPLIKDFPQVKGTLREDNSVKKDRQSLAGVWVGTFNPRRGLMEMVEAVGILKKENILITIYIIGDGDESISYKLHSLIKERGLEDLVKMVGFVKHELLWDYISRADFGILLDAPVEMNLNAVANKMYEYMGAGRPVIASNLPGFRKIIVRNKCGILVNSCDPTNIAAGLKLFVENFEKTKIMGENGRKAFLSKYNWEAIENNLFQIYKSLEAKNL